VIENDTPDYADGRVTSTLTGKVTEESTGAIIKPGTTTTTDYNAQGRVNSTTDQYGNTTRNEYDISGNLIETVNPNGTVVRTVYDAMGRPIRVTDAFNPANGNPSGTETIYDSLGQAIATERFRNVDIVVTADPTYSGVYDESFTPPTGSPVSTTSTTYTAQGQVATQVGTDGQTTAYTYYPNGQQETVTTAYGTSGAETTTYVYHTAPTSGDDGDYQLVTDPRGYTTRTDYDAQGRTIKVTYDVNADGSISGGAISTSTSYSPYGQTVTNTDEMGRVTTDKYDDAGNLIEVDQPQVLDPATNTMTTPVTAYGYDAYGDEISQTDANGHVTHFTYDALGEQTGRTLPDSETENTTYDAFGRVLTSTDFKGQTTAYTYDDTAIGDGEETGEYFFAAGVSALDSSGDVQTSLAGDSTVTTYDNLGRTATVTDSTGTATDSYDAEGNLIKQVKPEGTINYVYDPATGRLMETWTGTDRSHEGTDTSYGYDAQGRLSTTTVTVLNGVTLSAAQLTIDTYDPDGNKATELLPNGMLTTYTYNGQDQMTGDTVTKGGTDVFTQQYTLAANGRRDAVSETQYNADGSVFSTVETAWGYDNLDRLTSEDYTSSVAGQSYADTFSYDLVGNRLSKTHNTTGNGESIAYTYNNDDQLLTETGTLNGSPEYSIVYAYDANGSLTSKTRTGTSPETDIYAYNLQNELVGSTVNGVTTTYATDAAGDRVSVTAGGTTTTSLVDDNNLTGYSQVLEQSTGGTITTSYIIGDRVLGQRSAGTPTYLVVDGQGSTRLVTDTTGAVTVRYSYDAFGNALGFTASGAATSILYTGQQFDAGLGLYHLRARDYDPETGTFTSFDSAMNANADPSDLHKYLYADGDPVDYVDPDGHAALTNALLGTAVHGFLNRAFEGFTAVVPGFPAVGGAPGPRLPAGPGISGGIQRWSNRWISSIAAGNLSPGSINRLRPDFVEINTTTTPRSGDLYELKPLSTVDLATGVSASVVADLAFYYGALSYSVPTVSWSLGRSWIPGVTVWPTFTSPLKPPGDVLVTVDDYSVAPGAIFYDIVGAGDVAELAAAAAAGIGALAATSVTLGSVDAATGLAAEEAPAVAGFIGPELTTDLAEDVLEDAIAA
jgi:RHS repeat-associated protein